MSGEMELEDSFDDTDYMPLEWYLASKKVSNQIGPNWCIHLMKLDIDDNPTDVYSGIVQMIPKEFKEGYYVLFGDRDMNNTTLHIGIAPQEIMDQWTKEASNKAIKEPEMKEEKLVSSTVTKGETKVKDIIEGLKPKVMIIDTNGNMIAAGAVGREKDLKPYFDYTIEDISGFSNGIMLIIKPKEETDNGG